MIDINIENVLFQDYRAETEEIKTVVGCLKVENEILILCCFTEFQDKPAIEDCEMTPFKVVRDKAPRVIFEYYSNRQFLFQALLDYWVDRIAYVDV